MFLRNPQKDEHEKNKLGQTCRCESKFPMSENRAKDEQSSRQTAQKDEISFFVGFLLRINFLEKSEGLYFCSDLFCVIGLKESAVKVWRANSSGLTTIERSKVVGLKMNQLSFFLGSQFCKFLENASGVWFCFDLFWPIGLKEAALQVWRANSSGLTIIDGSKLSSLKKTT